MSRAWPGRCMPRAVTMRIVDPRERARQPRWLVCGNRVEVVLYPPGPRPAGGDVPRDPEMGCWVAIRIV
jgi:hypothetical protein